MAQSKSTARAAAADEPVKVPSAEEAAKMRQQLAAFERAQQQEQNADLVADLEPMLEAAKREGFVESHEAFMTMARPSDEELDRGLRNYRTVVTNLLDTIDRKAVVAGLVDTSPTPPAP